MFRQYAPFLSTVQQTDPGTLASQALSGVFAGGFSGQRYRTRKRF